MAKQFHRSLFACALLSAFTAFAANAAGDAYDTAVSNPARFPGDVKRDKLDHPAELLRLAGIKPGMQVIDFLAAGGYWSELLSYAVGPKGHVVMLNNTSFARWSDGDWQKHIASNRLPNVENRIVDLADMKLGAGTADAIFVIKVYHDLYWVDKDPKNWPKVDVPKTLDQLAEALKPGGTLLVVDHSAKEGSASNDAGSLHRIEEAYAKKDWESHGLKLVGHSDILRRPDDKRDLVSYQGPATGKTDRFVLVFRKT